MKNISLQNYARYLVRCYSTFNKSINAYDLDITDLTDFEINRFAGIFIQDRLLANEACGSDNPEFENKMFPSLIKFLLHGTNREDEIDFANQWREGIAKYFHPQIQSLIDQALELYNMENAA